MLAWNRQNQILLVFYLNAFCQWEFSGFRKMSIKQLGHWHCCFQHILAIFRKKFGLLSVCWKWFFGKTMHSAPPKRCTVDDWNQFCKFLQDCWENPSEHSEVSLVYLSLVFKVFPTCWSQDSGFWPKFYVAQNKGRIWASRVEDRTTWDSNPLVFKN